MIFFFAVSDFNTCSKVCLIVHFIIVIFQIILQVFDGNSGKHDIVKNSLEEFASARFIRFQPTAFHSYKSLRVEVYGAHVSAGDSFTSSCRQQIIYNFLMYMYYTVCVSLNVFTCSFHSYYKELVSKTKEISKEPKKDEHIYVGRSTTLHNLLFCAHTFWLNYITVTFLLVSSSGTNHDQLGLCRVMAKRASEQKHRTRNLPNFITIYLY